MDGTDLLKISWIPVGFPLTGKGYAAKICVHGFFSHYDDFALKAKQLCVMLTDYEQIYYEICDLTKKFTSLNAKLSGPEEMLLDKVRSIFESSTTEVLNENRQENKLEFDLKSPFGKRILRWHFYGQLMEDCQNAVFLHITRPLLNMLSVLVEDCDLSSLNVARSFKGFNNLFGKPAVQKFYEAVAVKSCAEKSNENDYSVEDKNKYNDDDNASLPATPPPLLNTEITIVNDEEKECPKKQSPLKKRKLKF
ncbi:unnamed protein product [Thelazia callipaeda]|uniref:DUF4806 domain-containing protein n=1 Tax=Thelazia callipaeda TaxID=103827 RepID=A0A0N5D7M5_THECL|nr:unnamed protein product [Thelazia callipaeda]